MSALARLYPPAPPLSPETRLVLCAAQHPLTEAQQESLRMLATAALDWQRVCDLAYQHRVHPLVYWNLKTHTRAAVPDAILDRLEHSFSRNVAHALRSEQQTARIVAALEAAEPILLKGLVVAYLLYGNPSLRHFKDIDLLVPQASYPQARAALLELGYQPRKGDARADYHETFFHPPSKVEVELHWRFSLSFLPAALDQHNYTLTDFKANRLSVRVLAADDLLLLLCSHAAKHRWHRLKWLCDIAQFVRAYPDFDWQALLTKAEHLHMRRAVLLNLSLAAVLLNLDLPPLLHAEIEASPIVRALTPYLQSWIFHQSDTGTAAQLRAISYFLLVQEAKHLQLPYLRHLLRR